MENTLSLTVCSHKYTQRPESTKHPDFCTILVFLLTPFHSWSVRSNLWPGVISLPCSYSFVPAPPVSDWEELLFLTTAMKSVLLFICLIKRRPCGKGLSCISEITESVRTMFQLRCWAELQGSCFSTQLTEFLCEFCQLWFFLA